MAARAPPPPSAAPGYNPVPIEQFPACFTDMRHTRTSPFEAAAMYSNYAIPLTSQRNTEFSRIGGWQHILCLVIPYVAFQHHTFSLPNHDDPINHCLFTDYSSVNKAPLRPAPVTINPGQACQLLALLHQLTFVNSALHFDYSKAGSRALAEQTAAAQQLANRLKLPESDWEQCMFGRGPPQSLHCPFFVEELVAAADDDGDDNRPRLPNALRFWCFVPPGRHLDHDLATLIALLDRRTRDSAGALTMMTKKPKPVKKGEEPEPTIYDILREGIQAFEEYNPNTPFPCADLTHVWETPLNAIVNIGRHHAATQLQPTRGAENVGVVMSNYITQGNLLNVPESLRNAVLAIDDPERQPQFYNDLFQLDDLIDPEVAFSRMNSSSNEGMNIDQDREVEEPPTRAMGPAAAAAAPMSFEEQLAAIRMNHHRHTGGGGDGRNDYTKTRFLPCAKLGDRPSDQRDGPESPKAVANIYSPLGAGFTSWNCTSIDPVQRNPFQYFMFPDADQQQQEKYEGQDITDTLRDDDSRLAELFSGGGINLSGGALISALGVSLRLSQPGQHFKGFPRPERVTLLSPALMPWMLPMMPLPRTIARNPMLMAATCLLNEVELYKDPEQGLFQMRQLALQRNSRVIEWWLSATLLAYVSGHLLERDNSSPLLAETSEMPRMPFPSGSNAETAEAVRKNDAPHLVFSHRDMYQAVVLGLTTLVVRSRSARDYLLIARTHPACTIPAQLPLVSYIAFEGYQQSFRTTANVWDIREAASSLDIFIHSNYQMETLMGYISSMVGGAVASHDEHAETRRHIYQFLTQGLRLMQRASFVRCVVAASHVEAMSPATRACFKYYNRKPANERWLRFNTHHYGNLNSQQVAIAHLNQILTVECTIFAHGTICLQSTLMAFAASRREGVGIGSGNAMVLEGPPSSGKSMAMNTIMNNAITGTTESTTRVSVASNYIQGNDDGLITLFDEIPGPLAATTNADDSSSIDASNAYKQTFEGGVLVNKNMDTSEKNKAAGLRLAARVIHLVAGMVLALSNHKRIGDPAMRSRLICKVVPNVSDAATPEGFALNDLTARDRKALYSGDTGEDYRTLQWGLTVSDRAEQMGALPKFYMTHTMALLTSILTAARKETKSKAMSSRSINHIRQLITTIAKLGEITRLSDDRLALTRTRAKMSDDKDALSGFTPHSMDQFVEDMSPVRYIPKSALFMALPLLQEYFVDSESNILMKVLADLAYKHPDGKHKTLDEISWYRDAGAPNGFGTGSSTTVTHRPRPPSRSHRRNNSTATGFQLQDANRTLENNNNTNAAPKVRVDYNYIVIRIGGSSFRQVLEILGTKMNEGRTTLSFENMKPIVTRLSAEFWELTSKNDSNSRGPPPLEDARPPTVAEQEAFGEDIRQERAQQAAADAAVLQQRTQGINHVVLDDEHDRPPPPLAVPGLAAAIAAGGGGDPSEEPHVPPPQRQRLPEPLEFPGLGHDEKAAEAIQNTEIQPRPSFSITQYQGGYVIVVADSVLRPHRQTSTNVKRIDETSPLYRALAAAMETHNLEVYPPEVIDRLEEAYPALKTRVKRMNPATGNMETLREYLQQGTFSYLTTSNYVNDVVAELVRRRRAQFDAMDTEATRILNGLHAMPRWLATSRELRRDPTKIHISVDLTAATEHDASWLNSGQPRQSEKSRILASNYDFDWESHICACQQAGVDHLDVRYLRTLPIVERWVAEARRETPGELPTKVYPQDSIHEWYDNAALSQVEAGLRRANMTKTLTQERSSSSAPVASVSAEKNAAELRAIEARIAKLTSMQDIFKKAPPVSTDEVIVVDDDDDNEEVRRERKRKERDEVVPPKEAPAVYRPSPPHAAPPRREETTTTTMTHTGRLPPSSTLSQFANLVLLDDE